MRMFFPKAICDSIEELLKGPVITVSNKPLFFDITLHKQHSSSRDIFNIYKTIDAGAVPGELIVNCFKDPAT